MRSAALVTARISRTVEMEAGDVHLLRRHILNEALSPQYFRAGVQRSKRRYPVRLHRPRLLVRHLEGEVRPWESRSAFMADLYDPWGAE